VLGVIVNALGSLPPMHGHAGAQTRQLHDHDGVHARDWRDRRAVADGGVELYTRREQRQRVSPDLGYCQVDRSRLIHALDKNPEPL
jgi:hypothetical protein